ncbi:MAG: mechanosensitive ion channel family protein [Comamonadaceae bacterium]|nr:MAG: mechanosensitive ion channel family protein [Comamonadaceae bacterium]
MGIAALPSTASAQSAQSARSRDTATAPLAAASSSRDSLDKAREEVAKIQVTAASSRDDAELARLRSIAITARSQGQDTVDLLQPQLDSVQARLTQLGTPTTGTIEPADVVTQRKELQASLGTLDADIRLARLLSVEADQTASQIRNQRRQSFQERLFVRTPSVLGSHFWRELVEDLPRDAKRLARLGAEMGAAAKAAPLWLLFAVPAGLVLVWLLRVWAERFLIRLAARHIAASRLRRSLHALTVLVLWTATAGLAAKIITTLFEAGSEPSEAVSAALSLLIKAVIFAAFVSGLGQALLAPGKPSRRLLPVPDRVADGLRNFPPLLAVLMLVTWLAEGLAGIVNANLATTVALNGLMALAMGAVMARALVLCGRLLSHSGAPGTLATPGDMASDVSAEPRPTPRPLWVNIFAVAGGLVLAVSLVCLLAGFVAIGSFIVRQLGWTVIVLASTFLLCVLVDDVFMGLLAGHRNQDEPSELDGPGGELHTPASKLRTQAAVLLSGVTRVLLAVLALRLLLAPFGAGPAEFFQRADQLQSGVTLGSLHIMPSAVFQALLVMVLAVLAVKVLQGWLQNHYLPTTKLDRGMQLSATTLFGYVGYIAAFSVAMSAVGIGLDRIAWVASALSVGIGFGLQAVVQNFVSGLIMLAERPVKVGDWVSLGGVEGDIRRINVRATEIQLGDRSTVIVPNSEFITKTVRNVTHANPLGLVVIRLPMPLNTPAEAVRDLLTAAFTDNTDILKTPAPSVQLDGIEGTTLVFKGTGYVSSPRSAYGVRSNLLFDALKRINAAGIPMSPPAALGVPATPPAAGLPAVPPSSASHPPSAAN